jgi:predicted SAM-dependent methyltransferase
METKLNLGCFNKQLPGFINIDIRPECNPDIVDNAFTLEKIEDNSVSLIYVCHMLEHLDYKESKQALQVWYRKLKRTGILRLAVPNLEKACSLYLLTRDKNLVKSMFWGSQRHDFDQHKNGWSYDELYQDLVDVGFLAIREWNWQDIEPNKYCDDYSQSYWPDMLKKYKLSNGKELDMGGVLMSLNLEGIK